METEIVSFSNAVTGHACPVCDDLITLHADGTFACSCQFVHSDESLPLAWSDFADELIQLRDFELSLTESNSDEDVSLSL